MRRNGHAGEEKAKAAIPVASKEGTPNDHSEISKLIAGYEFLQADQVYQAATVATAEESGEVIQMHSKEIDSIRGKLASAEPQKFSDAEALLRFAVREAEEGLSTDNMELKIFANVAGALPDIRIKLAIAAREAAYDTIPELMESL